MEEEYNVVGQEFDDALRYPEPIPDNDENTPFHELNCVGRRGNKRRFEELADFPQDATHPIDWHMRMPLSMEEREAKRHKELIEEEIIERLTTRIIEARGRRHDTPLSDDFNVRNEPETIAAELVMRLPPVDGSNWLGVSDDGSNERFYIRLSKPTRRLARTRQNLIDFQFAKIREEAKLLTEKLLPPSCPQDRAGPDAIPLSESAIHQDSVLEVNSSRAGLPRFPGIQSIPDASTSAVLWVDKYAPSRFSDLMSDDGINRSVLTWLKLWDECVFHRKLSNMESMIPDSENKKESFALDSGKLRRPYNKVLLLSGPAGLGKTTLANVVAKHCGYNTVEVNASNNRTVGDFERFIESTTRSSKTVEPSGNGRPVCLILDEIDGAPADAVRFLVRTVQATGKKALKRPIICICNNLFAPSLRDLRAIALNIAITPSKEERLIERLSNICEAEDVSSDHVALEHLANHCRCDIRLSINILQLVSASAKAKRSPILVSDIRNAMKSHDLGGATIFDGWGAVLALSRHSDSKGVVQNEESRLQTVDRIATELGDDRFVLGLHSNYIRIQLPVGTLKRASANFVFYDFIQAKIAHHQNYAFAKYFSSFYGSLHLAVATHSRISIKFPQFEQNMALRLRESSETLATVRSRSLIYGSASCALLLDILPTLLSIVQPPIRPLNEHLYSRREQAILSSVVDIMVSFNLSFVANMVNTEVHYTFQPAIDILTLYNLQNVNHRSVLPSSTRQMIARQVAQRKVQENSTVSSQSSRMTQFEKLSQPKKRIGRCVSLYFRYNQGFSNAVKKNVRMCNLLS